MTSLISTTSLLLVLFSTVAQHGAASLSGNYGVAATSAGGSSGGRSNFGRRLADEPTPTYKPSVTYSPTIPGEFAFGGDDEFNYDYNYNDDIDGPSAELQETSATATSGNIDEDEVVAPVPSPKTDNVPAPAGPGGDDESDTPPPALKCSFCEEGMPDLELVPPDAGGKNCAEVKGVADENLDGTDVCTKFIQPVQSACCPQSLPSVGDGVPPAVGGAGVAEEEEVTVTTTTPAGDGGEDNAEVPTTPTPEIIGGEANAFVEDQGNAENTTATTAATATPSAASQANTSTATPVAISLGECIQSAENEGKDDPLFTCCATHPDEELCILNSCMDFESGVITCQCKKVKGIGSEIFHGNDPTMAGFLPEDFDDFLDTFRKCCPSKVTSPSEFNDCYYDEISEEIMEEIEKEFEERPTFKPTPRPSSAYTPKSDDEDPVSKEGAEDFSNGQKDDSFQGVVNAYLDGVESPDEMKSDKNVQVVAVSLVVVFLVLLLLTAHLVMEHPDGLCASFCRLILKCLCCVIRVLCLPCRALCCKGSDQTRSRRTHAPMRAPFPSDLELA